LEVALCRSMRWGWGKKKEVWGKKTKAFEDCSLATEQEVVGEE